MARLIDLLIEDVWPEPKQVVVGVTRKASYLYEISPEESYAVLTFSDSGDANQMESRLVVEVALVTDMAFERAIGELIGVATTNLKPTQVPLSQLADYCSERKFACLLRHPQIELPAPLEGFSIAHASLPLEEAEKSYTVLACLPEPGILARTQRGARGAFLRLSRFFKLEVVNTNPTRWDHLLEDPIGEED